jgi:hypothetical protein
VDPDQHLIVVDDRRVGRRACASPARPWLRLPRHPRQPTGQVLERFAAGGSRLVLIWWGFAFEARGWKLAGTLVPLAHIGWSVWLLALGIGLLITA